MIEFDQCSHLNRLGAMLLLRTDLLSKSWRSSEVEMAVRAPCGATQVTFKNKNIRIHDIKF